LGAGLFGCALQERDCEECKVQATNEERIRQRKEKIYYSSTKKDSFPFLRTLPYLHLKVVRLSPSSFSAAVIAEHAFMQHFSHILEIWHLKNNGKKYRKGK